MRLLSAIPLLTLFATPLAAQGLGQTDFPTSAKPEAQAPFMRGLLLLHSFEYEDAAQAFREAEAADSGFALAYWGEAMTHTHPLWNEQDTAAARTALRKLGDTPAARLAKAPTDRERRYLETTEALYFADASKPGRDTLTARAFERLSAAYPDDQDAKVFYALWLMGLSQGVRNVPTYMRAGALAEEVYRKHPQHPGALHYIIHAFDDPIHAPLGLFAAREYSQIVPNADHAQHMTTHIFLALGMWEETVRQNVIASGPDSARWKPGHYTSWMNYGLLQEGKFADARRQLDVMRANLALSPTAGRQSGMLSMRAHYLIDTGAWSDSAAGWVLDTSLASPAAKAMDAYVVAVAQIQQGHLAVADGALARLDRMAKREAAVTDYARRSEVPKVLAIQLRARLAWARGRKAAAIAMLKTAGSAEDALPAEFGPPEIVKPTHELLGELLLASRRPAEAQREFERALELAPGRFPALYGLLHAANEAGDTAQAEYALDKLEYNWREADSGLPQVAEFRRLRASQ